MWKKPEYSKRQINDAGLKIIDPNATHEEYAAALDVVDNWRAAHAYPMNTFAINLRRQIADIDGAMVVRRLKRLDTICYKLERYPEMNLYRMQDLGGCRVIVPTIEDVYKVKNRLENSRIRHIPKKPKNYIETPKPETGYRGVHLIYKYRSEKNTDFNGLLVEIQIRTRLQHLWATAVETVGVFTDNGLKFNQGSNDWLLFFKLVSAMFAVEEGTPLVAGVPTDVGELLKQLDCIEKKLNAIDKIHTIGLVTESVGHVAKRRCQGYYLLILDLEKWKIEVKMFDGIEKGLDEATAAYNDFEKNKGDKKQDAVLVSAESYETLVDAYPNYFANIHEFSLKYYDVMTKQLMALTQQINERTARIEAETERIKAEMATT